MGHGVYLPTTFSYFTNPIKPPPTPTGARYHPLWPLPNLIGLVWVKLRNSKRHVAQARSGVGQCHLPCSRRHLSSRVCGRRHTGSINIREMHCRRMPGECRSGGLVGYARIEPGMEVKAVEESDGIADEVRWEPVALVDIHRPILTVAANYLGITENTQPALSRLDWRRNRQKSVTYQ